MAVVLRGKELDSYNKTRYSDQWLSTAGYRLGSGYYKNDHFQDTLDTILGLRGGKVLECGIGTGEFFALGLARGGKDVYGIDFSSDLLGDCRRRFGQEHIPVRLGMADVAKIPFGSGSFDITFAIGVMPYVHDAGEVVREMLRVTKPGGTVIFDFMNPWHISQCTNYWYRFVEASRAGFKVIEALKRVKSALGLKTNFKTVAEKINFRLISPLRVRRIIRLTGYEFSMRGYSVLLPVNMPILGARANICDRSKLFSSGLKDSRVLKYFGSKMVVTIRKR